MLVATRSGLHALHSLGRLGKLFPYESKFRCTTSAHAAGVGHEFPDGHKALAVSSISGFAGPRVRDGRASERGAIMGRAAQSKSPRGCDFFEKLVSS